MLLRPMLLMVSEKRTRQPAVSFQNTIHDPYGTHKRDTYLVFVCLPSVIPETWAPVSLIIFFQRDSSLQAPMLFPIQL